MIAAIPFLAVQYTNLSGLPNPFLLRPLSLSMGQKHESRLAVRAGQFLNTVSNTYEHASVDCRSPDRGCRDLS